MKLERLENRPLDEDEIIFKRAFLSGNTELWTKPMTFAEYEDYEKQKLIAQSPRSHYYKEKSCDRLGVTINAVESLSHAEIALHRRYSYPVLHNHDYIEVFYVAEGNCIEYMDQSAFDLKAGDVCIMAPNSFHAISCTNDESCIINMMINRDFFDHNFLDVLRGGKLLVGFLEGIMYEKCVSPYILFPTGHDEWLRVLARQMLTETVHKQHAYERSINLLTSEFLLHLARDWEMHAIVSDNHSNLQNGLIVAVLSFLNINYSNATLSSTADYFGYSSAYLSRMIHDNTGMTFNSIITRLQMERAAALLTTTKKSLTEIAHEVGCFDSSHFSKKFKKYYGVMPKQFVKMPPPYDQF